MAAYASVSNVRLVVRDGEGVAGPAWAGADERGPVHVRSGPYSSGCRCHRGRTYCCPCTRSPFLLEGFGFAPPSFVLFGLLGEKEFAVSYQTVWQRAFWPRPSPPAARAGIGLSPRSAATSQALFDDVNHGCSGSVERPGRSTHVLLRCGPVVDGRLLPIMRVVTRTFAKTMEACAGFCNGQPRVDGPTTALRATP